MHCTDLNRCGGIDPIFHKVPSIEKPVICYGLVHDLKRDVIILKGWLHLWLSLRLWLSLGLLLLLYSAPILCIAQDGELETSLPLLCGGFLDHKVVVPVLVVGSVYECQVKVLGNLAILLGKLSDAFLSDLCDIN